MTILEFHEETQDFRLNQVVNKVPKFPLDSFGWKKVNVCESDYQAWFFSDFIKIEYLNKDVKLTVKNVADTTDNLWRFLSAINNLNNNNQ